MTARRTLSRVTVALALLVALVAIYLRFTHREEREYAKKLGDYEKGESEYAKLSRATGGDQLLLDPGGNTDLSAYLSQQGLEAVLWKQIGTLDGSGEAEIPVDGSVRKLGLSILGSSSRSDSAFSLRAVEPGGRRVEGRSAGVQATLTKNGAIYVIDAPASGIWKLTFEGHGSYQLAAKAESDLSWDVARFVEKGGRPGHEGWFPISGRLKIGGEQTFEARFSRILPDKPEIFLVDSFGDEIAKAHLVSLEREQSDVEILGQVVVPKRTFRFVLRAGDVQRVFDTLFDPETSRRTYSWTYRSSTPDSDCALVDFLLLTARGTREMNQVLWTCARNETAGVLTTAGSASVMMAAAELPEAGKSMIFEGVNRLGDGPLALSPEECEQYVALLHALETDPGEMPPPPAIRARCEVSGTTARLELVVEPAGSGPPPVR